MVRKPVCCAGGGVGGGWEAADATSGALRPGLSDRAGRVTGAERPGQAPTESSEAEARVEDLCVHAHCLERDRTSGMETECG